jgi:hypothetical protein
MPAGIYKRKSLEERFWSKVNKTEFCWIWTASVKKNGYGQIGYNGTKLYAHRLSWELNNGTIPEDKLVLHKCDNPKCVNPDHLFIGTTQDNINDKIDKNRQAKGEINGMSKLTDINIIDIRKKYHEGIKNRDLCKEYNVSHSTIHRIVFNRSWKHINEKV